MKSLTIRTKITLWFSIALVLIAGLAMIAVMAISSSVIQKGIKDNLVEMVEENVDEVEFYENLRQTDLEKKDDLYLEYQGGYLEIDDDFLDRMNGIYTALYDSEGNLLYGENPVAREAEECEYRDGEVQTVRADGVRYYLYDRALKGEGLTGLWLRGTVSETQGVTQTYAITHLTFWVVPVLVILSVLGGYLIAGRFLRPVKEIGRAADSIREGNDLTKRIDLGKGDDELHRLARSFDRMFDRLEASFKAEQQFTSDASHELRTPVTVILSQCEYILEEPREAEEYAEALEVIERQGKKISVLIQELLEFTRLEQNAGQIAVEALDFSALCQDVLDDMEILLSRGMTLRREITPGIRIKGNPSLLTRMLENLVSNACRYGKENGHILVKLEASGNRISLSVADDGIGIEKEKHEKIWNRFYQADASHAGEGAGLGLALVKSIAGAHGGTVTVESEPGMGSTFTFRLENSSGF